MLNHKSSNDVKNPNEESSLQFKTISPTLFDTLTKEELNEAKKISKSVDVSKFENVLAFGATIQEKLKHFTHNLFVHVRQTNTTSIRETLFQLQKQLETINTDKLVNSGNFISKFFKRNKKSPQEVISEYHRLSKIIDRLTIQLQHAQENLIQDSQMLDKIYDQNKNYFDQLNVYIAALEIKKNQLINELKKEESNLNHDNPIAMQLLQDSKNAIEWVDRRIYDMQISREIAIQTAPQIRMIQETNHLLLEKIQTSILTTIPLWQSQISIIVNLNKQRRLQQNSKRFEDQMANGLEISSTDLNFTLNELKKTQHSLINSIDEALKVQTTNDEQQNTLQQTIETLPDIKKA